MNVAVVTDGLGVLPDVVIVGLEFPDPPFIGFWLKAAIAPAGNPETLSVTLPVNPPVGVIVIG